MGNKIYQSVAIQTWLPLESGGHSPVQVVQYGNQKQFIELKGTRKL